MRNFGKLETLLAVLLLMIVVTDANAQRRRRGNGTTFGVTGRMSFLTQSDCYQPAMAFSVGKDHGDKRSFIWHDIEMVLPTTFTYKSPLVEYNSGTETGTVKVKAKAIIGFAYRFNYAYYLADNTNEDNHVLPFVNIGASALLHSTTNGDYVTTPENPNGYITRYPMNTPTMTFGFNGGLGVLFRVNERFGVKLTGGYSLQTKALDLENIGDIDNSNSDYFHYRSHPYASVGLRFRVVR